MAERNVIDMGATSRIRGVPKDAKIEVENITPELAKEYLQANVKNRRASKRAVRLYKRDIEAGNWKFTGDPIRFNGAGTLIDGQHRLLAIAETGVTLPCLVIRGLDLDVQEHIDQGYKRQVSHHLQMREVANPLQVAAAARFLFWLKHKDQWGEFGWPTVAEVLALVDRHPRLVESVSATVKGVPGVHPSIISGLHYVGSSLLKDRETADAFAGVFASGEPTYDGDAAHAWRERLVNSTSRHTVIRSNSRRVGSMHAWNLFRRQEAVRQFKIPEDCIIEGLDLGRI